MLVLGGGCRMVLAIAASVESVETFADVLLLAGVSVVCGPLEWLQAPHVV